MAHSSWGPGWPNCQGGAVNKSFLVETVQGIVTFPGGVRAELCELVSMLVRETANRGYVFGVAGNPSYGCWGYNCRPISGTSKPSNHSWGLAVDINAPRNPYGGGTDMPPWMVELWESYGFRWGGNYSGTKDPMHYEFLGSVSDCANQTARARDNGVGGGTPVPIPPNPQPQPPSGAPTREQVMALPQLKKGATGQYVRNLQGLLCSHAEDLVGNANTFVDGDFGSKTDSALRTWQARTGVLAADGICGPQTWSWLTGVS